MMAVREYGQEPYRVAVIHGGPGAPGYMAPVARELATRAGVIEPLQSADSLEGQIVELYEQLSEYAGGPVVLVGSSWGAVLSLFIAARYPNKVQKLILIGSAVFDADSSLEYRRRRMERLSPAARAEYERLSRELDAAPIEERDAILQKKTALFEGLDMFDPVTTSLEVEEVQYDVLAKVWEDFVTVRDRRGYLEQEFSKISCVAVVIHGEYDPHPFEGVRPYLEKWLKDVEFYLLPECGHYPWLEKRARGRFYEIVGGEL